MTDQAVRLLVGMSERRVCLIANVCRDTLQRFERGEEISSPEKLAGLRATYAWLRLGVTIGAQNKIAAMDAYDEDERPTLPPSTLSGVRAA